MAPSALLGITSLPRARILRGVSAAAGAGVLLAALGPFGTYLNPGPISRTGYWVAAMLLGFVLYGGAFAGAGRLAPPGHRWRAFVLVGAILLAGIPETAITRALAFRLWPELAALGLSWPLWFAQASLLGLTAVAVAERLRRSAPSGSAMPIAVAGSHPVPALPNDVLALQMEDHYVRVYTARGSDLVLMPLVRAMDNLDRPGLRVHRSWWVARDAVVAVDGTPRAMRLRLSNGLVAPVARSAVVRLREAGWLSP